MVKHAQDEKEPSERGPTALWSGVPSSAPCDRGYLNGLTMRTPSRSSNPGRSSE